MESQTGTSGTIEPGYREEKREIKQKIGNVQAGIFVGHQVNNYASTQNSLSHEGQRSSSNDGNVQSDNPVPDSIKLTDSIFLLHKESISRYGTVCRGVKIFKISEKQIIAIKTLKFNEQNDKEAKILVKLCPHPNVANIIESGVYSLGPIKHNFIAMELCGSQNLAEYIKEKKSQSSKVKSRQTQQLVDSIAHIHKNEVIHRDLKPDNVLLSPDGNYLKIIDFGLSKELSSGHSVTNLSTLRVGTDGWRAPETYNSNVISKATDVYSLALVIYYIETDGHHPFGDDPDDWNANIKKNRGLDLSKLQDKTEIVDLLRWMLRFKQRERPTIEQVQKHKYFGGSISAPDFGKSLQSRKSLEIENKELQEKLKQAEMEIKVSEMKRRADRSKFSHNH
uniref:serine/threonine-protein kinase/endoribonuclease ire-1-like n=1 Tax=Styela clava TaxID=7725 RepID=UPI00193A9F9B|nr:serine/threonine-protein kinase/endoribonuclease ire-1-like [Styela clava]